MEKIWGTLLHLGSNMWDDFLRGPDELAKSAQEELVWPNPKGPDDRYSQYRSYLRCQDDLWEKAVDHVAKCGMNTLFIDLGEGMEYPSHPELKVAGTWSVEKMRKELERIRALGLEPVPKLNFSTCHDSWLKEYHRMVSTSEYYRVVADVIRDTCEIFGNPRLFHIGFDEENEDMQRNYEMIIIRNSELWWHDLFFMAAECEKYGARPWVWSDYYWDYPEVFKKNMPKSILQSNWYYYPLKDHPVDSRHYHRIKTYEYLDELGYEQVPTSSSCHGAPQNNYQTVAYAKDKLSPELLKGFMVAPWYMTAPENRFALLNDADRLYYARKALYPEQGK